MKSAVKKKIIVLGSTGSIGLQTLEIARTLPDSFRVVGLSAHRNASALFRQMDEFKTEAAALTDTNSPVPESFPRSACKIFHGPEELLRMIEETDADIVVNGIAGSAGLLPSFAAVKAGKNLALANKETIVMAGPLILEEAGKRKVQIIPVDSEHSAVFHLLGNDRRPSLAEIILTASGGAFRDLPRAQLKRISLKDALAHPTWKMGKKITIDSATMANKALEVMEAHYLFGLEPEKIKVMIHPQSYVHSLIRTIDGVLYAQLSEPDMRIPILKALTYPAIPAISFGRLELADCVLEFRPVDLEKYPLLEYGYAALAAGPPAPVVFNAANEIAVQTFCEGKIAFTDIARVVGKTLTLDFPNLNSTLLDVIFIDNQVRTAAQKIVSTLR